MQLFTLQSNQFGYPIYAAELPGDMPITDNASEATVFGSDNIEMKAKYWSANYGYKFEAVPCAA